jgi:hypothetical protein
MKTSFIIALLICFSSFAYAQSVRPKDIKDDPIIKERIANNGKRVQASVQVSQYFGLEENIKAMALDNLIPSNCPTSVGFSDKKKYIEVLNLWIKDNQDKIKPDHRNNFISE